MTRICIICGKEFEGSSKEFRCKSCADKDKIVLVNKMRRANFYIKPTSYEEDMSDLPV